MIIDSTMRPKPVMFPTDVKLINRAPDILARLAKSHGALTSSERRARRQDRPGRASALRSCPSVQTCQQDFAQALDLSQSGDLMLAVGFAGNDAFQADLRQADEFGPRAQKNRRLLESSNRMLGSLRPIRYLLL